MSKSKEKFDWKEFLSILAAIAIPVSIQNLFTTTAPMIDTMMVAPLGELHVGALGLCAQFSSLMFAGYWGFVGGGMLFISQYWGSKEDDGIERSYGMTWVCMMIVAILFACMALFFPQVVMRIYTDKQSIQEIGVQYLRIVGIAYIFQVFSMAVSSLLRSTEKVKIPMIASITSVAVNLFLNWVFIYGNLGVKAMGIRGAALATTIAAAVNLLMLYLLCARSRYYYLFHIRGHFKWSREHVKIFLVKCFPIICNEVFMGIAGMIINITLGRQNEQVIAALAVFRTLEGLIIGFFAGFSMAASTLIGKCVGAGELNKAYERAKRLTLLCSAVILVVGMIIFAVQYPLLHAMSLSGESYKIGVRLVGIYIIVATIRMGNWTKNDTFRAAGDAVFGTVLEIAFMYVVVIPCVLITGFAIKAPYWVIFLCCFIDEPIRYVIMHLHLYSGKWLKPVTDSGIKALEDFNRQKRNGSK